MQTPVLVMASGIVFLTLVAFAISSPSFKDTFTGFVVEENMQGLDRTQESTCEHIMPLSAQDCTTGYDKVSSKDGNCNQDSLLRNRCLPYYSSGDLRCGCFGFLN